MADGTQLNAGLGGDLIYDEDIGGGVKMPASKIHTGAHGTDGGAVTSTNAFPILISDLHGNTTDVDNARSLRVQQPYRLVGTTFGTSANGVDSNFWTATNTGTGSGASIVSNGFVTLTAGTTNPGWGQIITAHVARFVFDHPMHNRFQVRIPTVVVTGSTRTWGMYTASGATPPIPVDGHYWSLSAAGTLSVNSINSNSGTPVTVSSGSFNGLGGASYTVDTNEHIYEIIALQSSVQFLIDGVLIHTMTPTTLMLSSTLNLSAAATCSGTGSSATMEIWAGVILRLGREISSPIWKHIAGANAGVQLKTGPGVLRTVNLNASAAASTVSLYDATSATNAIALLAPGAVTGISFDFNLEFYTGLFVVTVNASTDVTINYE